MDVLVPKLMLQPIVENSIIHGFADSGGRIVVRARMAAEELEVTVRTMAAACRGKPAPFQ